MQEIHYRSVEDVGIGTPISLTDAAEPMDTQDLAQIALSAGQTRGVGLIAAARELAADPTSKLRTVLGILKLLVFGRAQQTIDQIAAAAPQIGCHQGCYHCCHQRVEVTIPEAILVFAQVSDPADPRHQKVLELAAVLDGLGKAERFLHMQCCPMLIDNQCSIYDDRPLMCRGLLANDPEPCRGSLADRLNGKEARPVGLYPIAQYSALGDQAAMRGICKDMGLQYDLVEMTLAVAAMSRDPTIIDRWIAGEHAFGPELAYNDRPAG